MTRRLIRLRGRLWLTEFVGDEPLPIRSRRGAYRRSIFPNSNPAGSAVRAAAWSNARRAA